MKLYNMVNKKIATNVSCSLNMITSSLNKKLFLLVKRKEMRNVKIITIYYSEYYISIVRISHNETAI